MLLLISGGFIPSDKGAGGGGRFQKNVSRSFGPLFGLNIRGGGGGVGPGLPGPSPGSATAYGSFEAIICFRFNQRSITKTLPIPNCSSQNYL